jgi:hypothetical protein
VFSCCEKIIQEKGLDAFSANEKKSANIELKSGPFKCFLKSLHTQTCISTVARKQNHINRCFLAVKI